MEQDYPLDRVLVMTAAHLVRADLAQALIEAGFHEALGFMSPRPDDGFLITGLQSHAEGLPLPNELDDIRAVIMDRDFRPWLEGDPVNSCPNLRLASCLILLPNDHGGEDDLDDMVKRIRKNPAPFANRAAFRLQRETSARDLADALMLAVQERRTAPDAAVLWMVDDERQRFGPNGWWGLLEQAARERLAEKRSGLRLEVIRSHVGPRLLERISWLANTWRDRIVQPLADRSVLVVCDNQFGRAHLKFGERWVHALRDAARAWSLWLLSDKNVPEDTLERVQGLWLPGRPSPLVVKEAFKDLLDHLSDLTRCETAPSSLEARTSAPPQQEDVRRGIGKLIGRCPEMQKVYREIETAAKTDHPVLLLGPTGTGKEKAAQEIHRLSRRGGGPFVQINCPAIPEHLIEAELFGHSKGAFTGAASDRRGLFAAANGGTLFLDEIGKASQGMQEKLLVAIQKGEYRRVGEERIQKADVRVLAAAEESIDELVARGEFREALLYRIATFRIELPPLRHRGDDKLLLARAFLVRFAEAAGLLDTRFTPRAEAAIMMHDWPGNVRELRNAIKGAVAPTTQGSPITPELLGLENVAGEIPSAQEVLAAATKERMRGLVLMSPALGDLLEATLTKGDRVLWRQLRNLVRESRLFKDESFRSTLWQWLPWNRFLAAELAYAIDEDSDHPVQVWLERLDSEESAECAEDVEGWTGLLLPLPGSEIGRQPASVTEGESTDEVQRTLAHATQGLFAPENIQRVVAEMSEQETGIRWSDEARAGDLLHFLVDLALYQIGLKGRRAPSHQVENAGTILRHENVISPERNPKSVHQDILDVPAYRRLQDAYVTEMRGRRPESGTTHDGQPQKDWKESDRKTFARYIKGFIVA